MLKTCEQFGKEFNVKYNSANTVCALFSQMGMMGITSNWMAYVGQKF